jgi:hypothetical protein
MAGTQEGDHRAIGGQFVVYTLLKITRACGADWLDRLNPRLGGSAESTAAIPGQQRTPKSALLAQRLVEANYIGLDAVMAKDHCQRSHAAAVLPQHQRSIVAEEERRSIACKLILQRCL